MKPQMTRGKFESEQKQIQINSNNRLRNTKNAHLFSQRNFLKIIITSRRFSLFLLAVVMIFFRKLWLG